MEIQELRVFSAIVDSGGFKTAAKQLGLTQPAVSQSLANLERKLGETLINRSSKSLTPIGLELLKHARFVQESELEFNSHLAQYKLGDLETLSIAVDHFMANFYCATIIKRFQKRYPSCSVKLRRMPAREIILAIKSKQFDIGLGPFQKNMIGLTKLGFLKTDSCLITGKSNKKLALYEQDPIQFLGETILLTSYLDDPNARPSKKKIRDYFKGQWEINDISLQLELVAKGTGATFISKKFLEEGPKKKQFVVLDKLPFATIRKEYGAYLLKENNDSELLTSFLEIAINTIT